MAVTVEFQFDPEDGTFLTAGELNRIKEWIEMCGGYFIEVDGEPLLVLSDGSW